MRSESTATDRALLVVALGVIGAGSIVWVGATTAAWITGDRLDASAADALNAAVRLPGRLGDPATAWPSETAAVLPGPVPYWTCTGLVAVAAIALGVAGMCLWQRLWRVGTEDRSRVGVDARAWMARAQDLRTLFVKGPVPGRFIVGRSGRRLVATECRVTAPKSRRPAVRSRQGDTGALALVGPSRSGKTVAAVAGILEWEGPAILSSVKTDLLSSTMGWRATKGEVKVYDPLGLTPCLGAGWSPLAQSGTVSGARRSARSLLEAVADDGTENLGMWKALAEYLMAGLFWVAANSDRSMATVVEWTLTQDRPRPDAPSEVDVILEELLTHDDPSVAREALVALHALLSVWEQDERPRSSIYVTAQSALGAFADPSIAAATRTSEIDLDWLLSGDNTLYICSPLKDQGRLSPAFGGLFDDLMTQAYERANRRPDGRLERRVLAVLDEAGNQRLEQLPNYASTVAGLGVQLVTIWQSVAQITRAYGRGAGIVLTNHLSKVFYTGLSDEDSLSYVAKVVGDEEVDARQLSGEPTSLWRSSVTDMTNRVSLVQPHCLRQMAPGDALLIHATLPPAFITTRRWFEDRSLRARAETPTPAHLLRADDPGGALADAVRDGGPNGDVTGMDAAGGPADVEAALRRLELLAAPQPSGRGPEAGT